ncbi:carbohydrate kinase family protein [Streptomyces sp. 8N616]|uniref:carbohydrate kinase family protein n=1 Tax=Streptomyces sp. 8N616 TaxID=3457414 RepID=UPI003FD06D20
MSSTEERADAPYDVLVVGGAGVDTVVRVDTLPVPYADSYGVPPIREWAGHTGTGVALGCAALGLATGFLDLIGDDPQGELVRRRLAESGVQFDPLVSPHGTRRAVNLVDAQGRRTSFYDGRDPQLDLRMPPDHYLRHLRRARHVHMSIMHFARFLFDDIEELGVPVSTDLHDWDGLDGHHREFALRADLVFLSASGAGERLADVMRRIIADGRAEAVIATAGAGGAYVLAREGGGSLRHVPAAAPPAPVVDSNGAGDAFACGFLYGRLVGLDLEDCTRLGAAAGAYACTGEGTHTTLIDEAGLAAVLDEDGPAGGADQGLRENAQEGRAGGPAAVRS